jgi:hypothetical protein
MARIKITPEFISDQVFGGTQAPVEIRGTTFDPIMRVLVLDIAGPDVPECDEVRAEVTLQQNRAGERLHTVVFKPID